ncbi:MAG: tetratricopeptide repeat protein [Microcoleus sp. PH2017_15_JOR_U_A]|uniref:tetratricopeptide repeat protein n=1 Tax=Microcoleus sp. PH2017_15_JOR_U_A TaxID=2798826 RepID=UPI001D79E513|nr:tetratricopeptide repeat protein [Microcoleus sp. PH2017_15_JOR_U_A]MCC3500630.1 tetratricopeptide repeat protein [Microcoleus sp. PH2017_15_JOR_U_A]
MPESTSLRDRYLALIDKIVEITLKGQIRSKEQVYQMLVQDIGTGTGEIFERCFGERLDATDNLLRNEKDEIKQAKANRSLRALKTIQGEWERWQKDNRVDREIASSIQQILTAESNGRLLAILQIIDPNKEHPLTLDQLQQLSKSVHQQMLQTTNPETERDLQQITAGIAKGLESWQRLEPELVGWIYQPQQLGFAGSPEQNGPWAFWSKKVNSAFANALLQTIARGDSIVEFAAKQSNVELGTLLELAIILQCLQRALVTWFDKQVYDSKVSTKASISTYITFSVIWSQLASGFNNSTKSGEQLANACFQVTLQILRTFSQREYFPLYGGIFASFDGKALRHTLDYLDEPLRRVEGTQAKARILTLLGYSMQAAGAYERSILLHKQSLEIARMEGDKACEVANLNHISRNYVAQKNYQEAINYSQRALIMARQAGERQGEANALANLGYSEVFQARQLEEVEPEVYESAISYLEQGLLLSEKLGDRQSQAFCSSSLGIAKIALENAAGAIEYLVKGWQAAQFSGDLYLQGLNLAYLAQAYYSLNQLEQAIFAGCLGMYTLEQIGAMEWRQSAGLLTILRGQMGAESFKQSLAKSRASIIPAIGVDGYDYIPELLEKYQQSI